MEYLLPKITWDQKYSPFFRFYLYDDLKQYEILIIRNYSSIFFLFE